MTNRDEYTEINAKTIDNWVDGGWEWGIPVSHEEFERAGNGKGEWKIFLTPCKAVPKEWFAPFYKDARLENVELLGLASGGGQQMPVMTALGANCTVLDLSDRQLENERLVAERENYRINIVKADMTKPLPFEDESFHVIVHPVANCYVEDVYHVWNECFRVLKKGGILLAGMDNGVNFLFDEPNADGQLIAVNKLPVNPLRNAEQYEKLAKSNDGIQFSHTMEEQIGGQLKAGFILTDLYEDRDSYGTIRHYFPQYIATRSVKPR